MNLKNTLSTNDSIREEEHVCASEDAIKLLSDDNSDSKTSNTSFETATSSSTASTFPAEHSTDNEGTPLKKNACSTMDIKKGFRNNQEVIFQVWRRYKP